jgi:hypothetical protein
MTKISHAVDGGSEISVDTSLLLAVGRALVVAVEGRSYLELG